MARTALTDEQALWIEQHHERFDGAGYPNGLAGAQISEGAGLLALADSWDVMTTVRSYSPAMPEPAALAECLSLAGSQFSPDRLQGARDPLLGGIRGRSLGPYEQEVALDHGLGHVVELAAAALRL